MGEQQHNKEQIGNFRDQLTTVDASGKRKWIYPLKPKGYYTNWRHIVSLIYYVIFFSLPFIKIDGRPLFLFNIPEAKFVIFGKIFWPQDFLLFGLIMLSALLFIALFTFIFGRMFCGWICPQTIFMEMLFRKIDYLIIGNAPKQKLLAKQKWTTEKISKYSIRYMLYLCASFIIANTFLAYIIGVDELWQIATSPISNHLGGFIAIVVFTIVFFIVYAFVREQVCTNICPYGRLQGVLLDKDSIVVTYDYKRGEPRAKFTKLANNNGDCIDCMQCVHVCPTGIDIRNGTQLECINCTACIDACNAIMKKINKPISLIRYDAENNIAEGKKFRFTGRIIGFSVALFVILTAITLLLINRSDVGVKLMRTQGLTYQERGADSIANLYNLKLENKVDDTFDIRLELENKEGHLEMVGSDIIKLLPASQASATFFIVLPKETLQKRKSNLSIRISHKNKIVSTVKTTFLAPIKIQKNQ